MRKKPQICFDWKHIVVSLSRALSGHMNQITFQNLSNFFFTLKTH